MAVWPPDDVVERLAVLARPEIAGLRWTDRRQWHVTLRFLGRADVGEARAALGQAILPEAPAHAVMGPEVGRFGQRVLHVPVSGLEGLAASVISATAAVGERPEDHPFAAHLTLARVSKSADVDLRGLTGEAIIGSWRVTDVTLVESRMSSAGATYEVVDRVALPG